MKHKAKRAGWLAIWHGVYFFLVRPRRLLYLVAAIIAGILLLSSSEVGDKRAASPTLPGGETATGQPAGGHVSELPPITGKIANGNSAFTKKLIHTMDSEDVKRYYSHFVYVMNKLPANETYKWMETNNMYGWISAGESFKANSGVYCRPFKQVTSYHGQHQRLSGMACQRRRGGWCRLRRSSAYSCEVLPSSPIDMFMRNLF